MAELKAKPSDEDVDTFIDSAEPEWKRDDNRELLKLVQRKADHVGIFHHCFWHVSLQIQIW